MIVVSASISNSKKQNSLRREDDLKMKEKLLYYCAVVLMPSILLFNLYSQNQARGHLFFTHTLVVATILSITSIVIFSLVYFFVRKVKNAFLVTTLFWILFWFFEQIFYFTDKFSETFSRSMLLMALFVLVCFVVFCLCRYSPPFKNIDFGLRIFAICVCVLFMYNLIPNLRSEITSRILASRIDSFIKHEFSIDQSLPSPDIYWFHMDGMLSLETVERFFMCNKDPLRLELEKRGFVVYKNAELNAGSTIIAMPVLFSPAFYDNFLREHLEEVRHLFKDARENQLGSVLARNGVNIIEDIIPNNEMFRALSSIDYEIILLAPPGLVYIMAPFNRLYDVHWRSRVAMRINENIDQYNDIGFWTQSKNLIELLTLTTPLSIIADQLIFEIQNIQEFQWNDIHCYSYEMKHLTINTLGTAHEKFIYRALLDVFYYVYSPKFVYIDFFSILRPHIWYWSPPSIQERDERFFEFYMVGHNHAVEVMLNAIDMILEQNPDAVIVLQSDHGFHMQGTQDHLLLLGFTESEVMELFLSVISAVRLPDDPPLR